MKTNLPKRPTPSAKQGSASGPRETATTGDGDNVIPESSLKVGAILVPLDFSEESRKALRYAVAFARQFNARIVLLHVVEPMAGPDFAYFPLAKERDKVLQAARRRLDALGRQCSSAPKMFARALVREGKAYQVIAEVARRLRVNLIIIATRGYTGAKHLLLGSTTERVVRHAPCPVLVVREGQIEFA